LNNSILITGASGFIGGALCDQLSKKYQIKAQVRRGTVKVSSENIELVIGDLSKSFNWNKALDGIEVVVHCAARVHVLNDASSDPLADFRGVNTFGTLSLAAQAATSGVKHFIYLSSISVNGVDSGDSTFTVNSEPNPLTPYAISKYEAELGLWRISRETGMNITIIRPPLVYGAGAPGNFGVLIKLIKLGVPLPFKSVDNNRRSYVSLINLIDLIGLCIDSEKSFNKIFLVSDGEDLSTAELIRKVGVHLKKRTKLFSMNSNLIQMVGYFFGHEALVNRLLSNLQVDITKTYSDLGWRPKLSFDEGLRSALDLK